MFSVNLDLVKPIVFVYTTSFQFSNFQEAGEEGQSQGVIHYRDDETMYVEAKADRVTVIFSTIFKDASDIILSEVFMREFREGRKASATAPTVLFSNKYDHIFL